MTEPTDPEVDRLVAFIEDLRRRANIPERNRAIEAEASAGGSWTRQALAGLTALTPGTTGLADRFAALLLCGGSPLPEPPFDDWKMQQRNQKWGSVFRLALQYRILDYAGTIQRRRPSRVWGFVYVRTGRCALPPKAQPKSRRVHHEQIACPVCKRLFVPKRAEAKTCSNRCRQRAHRERNRPCAKAHPRSRT
jgi:hypothetical protein